MNCTCNVFRRLSRPMLTAETRKFNGRRFMNNTLQSFSMEGKVCVVTGAAGGLGKTFCRAFAESGCNSLAILDLKHEEAQAAAEELKTAVERTKKDMPDFVGIQCDISSEDSVRDAFSQVMSRWGRVDAVVANAGIIHNISALEYPADKMKRLYDINVHGTMFTAREAAKNMIPAGKGNIVLIASAGGSVVSTPQAQTPYNTWKAAVKHLAANLAVEWAEKGLRVNSLSPGYMLTDLLKSIIATDDNGLKDIWESMTPMKRMGNPDDLKGAIVYLCSDASKFVTGLDLRVDGGYTVL
ncbi:NAD(P)-binding protein [Rickenella mellea]|uniref:NAD(P)-binding protein n=1 Tax=Rickenella mellea TaxID=50990 RepID=A0A4Y7QBY7_9AGAM|nr:NAD(P)-binding protein [Rickenella mellea]